MGRCDTNYGKFHADLVFYSVTPERYCQLYNQDHFFKLTPESGTLLDGSQRTLESLGDSFNGNIDTFGWDDSVPPFAGTAVFFSLSDLVLFFSVHSLMTSLMVEQSISTLSSCLVLLTITPTPPLGLQRHRRRCVVCLLPLDVEKNGNFNPRKIWRVGLKANPVSSTFFLHPEVLRHTKNPFLSQRSQCELLSTYKSRWSIPISNTSLSWNTQSFIYNNSPLSSPPSIPQSEMYTHLFFLPFSLSTPTLRLCLMKTNLKSLPLTPSPPWIPNKRKQQQASPGLERRRATKWYNNWGYILPWIVSIVGGKGPE